MEMVLKFSKLAGDVHPTIASSLEYKPGNNSVIFNGVEHLFQITHVERCAVGSSKGSWDCEYDYTVTLQSVEKTKSKQELEAEDAVKKAKTSLEAAQAVLQSVKGV